MGGLVRLELDGAVGVITLDNPPHNLIGDRFIAEYSAAQEEAVSAGARAILVCSDLRHFCAGADPASLSDRSTPMDAVAILDRLESIPVPTVAALHGAVLGGGFELALACDFIVAAETATIGSVEVGIGLAPLLGAVQRLAERAGPARAREIAMLGRRACDTIGRDPATIELGVFNAPPDEAKLVTLAEAGLARAVVSMPQGPRDEVLTTLERVAPLVDALRDA